MSNIQVMNAGDDAAPAEVRESSEFESLVADIEKLHKPVPRALHHVCPLLMHVMCVLIHLPNLLSCKL